MSAPENSTAASPSDPVMVSPPAAGEATVTQPAAGAATATATQPAAGGKPDSSGADSRTADFIAGPGGVMTDEVGVVTGDLTLRTELAGGEITLRVQYKDADEWYGVTGGRTSLKDPADLDAVHTLVVGLLNRPEG